MKDVFEKIVKKVEELSKTKDVFLMPKIDGYEMVESDYSSGGATLYGRQYKITNGKEEIIVTYESKDKCKTFQVKPDMNIVSIKHYKIMGELLSDYSNSWEDKI